MTEQPNADGKGLRYNHGKVRVDLIPPEWVWGLAQVMTRGAIKYETRNWERGMSWSHCLGSCLRHVFKFVCGERFDQETGCHHMALAAWNCLALMSYDVRSIGQNDLVGSVAWLEGCAQEPGPALLARMKAKAAEEKSA